MFYTLSFLTKEWLAFSECFFVEIKLVKYYKISQFLIKYRFYLKKQFAKMVLQITPFRDLRASQTIYLITEERFAFFKRILHKKEGNEILNKFPIFLPNLNFFFF